jgi:hypothetical protein
VSQQSGLRVGVTVEADERADDEEVAELRGPVVLEVDGVRDEKRRKLTAAWLERHRPVGVEPVAGPVAGPVDAG